MVYCGIHSQVLDCSWKMLKIGQEIRLNSIITEIGNWRYRYCSQIALILLKAHFKLFLLFIDLAFINLFTFYKIVEKNAIFERFIQYFGANKNFVFDASNDHNFV